MMLVYSVEELNPNNQREIERITKEYYDKTDAGKGLPPLVFDWDMFAIMQETAALQMYTARSNTELVGFAWYLITPMLHHKSVRVAECDGLVVDMHHRGKGIGRSLYLFAEAHLIDLGVQRIINRYKTVYKTKPIFESLGFELIEYVYMKKV